MSAAFAFVLLLVLAALPMAPAYVLIARRRPSFVPRRFILATGAGVLAIAPAVVFQLALPRPSAGFLALLFRAFVAIAAVEELAKFAGIRAVRRFLGGVGDGAAAGIAASLAFALFETAAYASSDLGVALVRAFTAAPLHAACGARVGVAAFAPRFFAPRSLLSLVTAVALHGVYDLALVLPGYPAIFPILLALVALASAVPLIRVEKSGDI